MQNLIGANSVSRRKLLKVASLGAAGTGLVHAGLSVHDAESSYARAVPEGGSAQGNAFDYRLLLGWINDNSTRPLLGKRWPITEVDEQTVSDYQSFLTTVRDYGYNGITLWGLYASHAWPVPLKSAFEPGRRRLIDRILNEADKLGIRVLYGLGVYSWGFEEIIKYDPTTARKEGRMAWGTFQPDNGVAMCYHSESARRWMREIVDLCVNEAGTQGFGFQSGDLGRCFCSQCRLLSDNDYHSRVINETAEYIKRRYPKQILGLSAWGVDLGGGATGLREITSHLDFLTDVTDQSARKGQAYRRSLTASLSCAVGSLGGAVIVPPQRWARDRWFLPHAEMTGRSIRSLHDDGGRAFEFFMGPMANPQFDLMTRFVGLQLSNPGQSTEQSLSLVVESLFAPVNSNVTAEIVRWLFDVERAYMTRVGDISGGEFDFEPLKGENAGDPIYLSRLSSAALLGYGEDLEQLAKRLAALTAQCRRSEKLQLIGRCLQNILRDIVAVQQKKALTA